MTTETKVRTLAELLILAEQSNGVPREISVDEANELLRYDRAKLGHPFRNEQEGKIITRWDIAFLKWYIKFGKWYIKFGKKHSYFVETDGILSLSQDGRIYCTPRNSLTYKP